MKKIWMIVIMIFVFSIGSAYAETLFEMGGDTSGNIVDLSSSGSTVSIQGDAAQIESVDSKTVDFADGLESYLEVSGMDWNIFNNYDTSEIRFTLNLDEVPNTFVSIIGNNNQWGSKSGWGIWICSNNTVCLLNSDTVLTLRSNEVINANQDYDIRVTKNKDGIIALYVDGVLQDTTTASMFSANTANLKIGKSYDSWNATFTSFSGKISNLKISTNVPIDEIFYIDPNKTTATIGDSVTVDLVIDNISSIYAEDVRVKYDTTLLNFTGIEEAEGVSCLYHKEIIDGELRFIMASKGIENVVDGKKVILKLKFDTLKTGEALIDVTRGRIADGESLEMDVEESKCGEGTILVEGYKDVNLSGQYTLLDLSIDAKYFGYKESDTDTENLKTDQEDDDVIDGLDLSYIVLQILDNSEYELNN